MSTTAYTSEPASELERLIADLSGSGLLVFVFGVGWWTAHLDRSDNAAVPRTGRPALVARRARRRRGELDDGRAGR